MLEYNYIILYENSPFMIVSWDRPALPSEVLAWYAETYAFPLEKLNLLTPENLGRVIRLSGPKPSFLEELNALSNKHEVVIEGCGCCGSPYLSRFGPSSEDPHSGSYREDKGEIRWVSNT